MSLSLELSSTSTGFFTTVSGLGLLVLASTSSVTGKSFTSVWVWVSTKLERRLSDSYCRRSRFIVDFILPPLPTRRCRLFFGLYFELKPIGAWMVDFVWFPSSRTYTEVFIGLPGGLGELTQLAWVNWAAMWSRRRLILSKCCFLSCEIAFLYGLLVPICFSRSAISRSRSSSCAKQVLSSL